MKKRRFILFGKKAEYQTLSWWENFMSGHLTIGNITIFGANAMNWSVNIITRKFGYICFSLPLFTRSGRKLRRKFGRKFYLSPNGTPWASTFYRGTNKNEVIRAKIRFLNFGHNFDTNKNWVKLRALNNKFEWLNVCDYDISKFTDESDLQLQDELMHEDSFGISNKNTA